MRTPITYAEIHQVLIENDYRKEQIAGFKRMLRKHQYRLGYCVECGQNRGDCLPTCELNQLLEGE